MRPTCEGTARDLILRKRDEYLRYCNEEREEREERVEREERKKGDPSGDETSSAFGPENGQSKGADFVEQSNRERKR